jgi:hypothetical protein
MRLISSRTLCAFAFAGLAGIGLASSSASAAELTLGKVLSSPAVVPACRNNDRLMATYKFVKGQLGSPDKCVVYRFIAKDEEQRACFGAIVDSSGQDQTSFLSGLGITGSGEPAFCNSGCNCKDTISYRSVN